MVLASKLIHSHFSPSSSPLRIPVCKRHKQEQDKLKKAFGDAWEQPEMVFTTGTGKWFDRNELNKRLKRLMKQNGSYRHQYKSFCGS